MISQMLREPSFADKTIFARSIVLARAPKANSYLSFEKRSMSIATIFTVASFSTLFVVSHVS